MKKYIIRWLLRLYMKHEREIISITEEEEMDLYRMSTNEKTIKLIRSIITAQMKRYWDATSDEERYVAKGSAMILKIIKDAHQKAIELSKIDNPDARLKEWKKYKSKIRIS